MTLNSKPIILWDNKANKDNIGATYSAVGYPAQNMVDWRQYTKWRSSDNTNDQYITISSVSGVVNSIVISAHNFYSICVQDLKLQYKSGENWVDVITFTPTSNRTFLKTFNPVNSSAQDWRLLIPVGEGLSDFPEVGEFYLGDYLEFPTWPSAEFDPDEQEKVVESAVSEEGHLLGAILKYTRREISLRFNYLSPGFITNDFLPFFNNHIPKPFYFAWDKINHPDEIYFVVMKAPRLNSPYGPNFRSLSFGLVGVAELD